jgi:hypothetical protein
MSSSVPIVSTLQSGGALKCSPRTHRFFIVQQSQDLSINQAEARKLASNGTLRPSGIDSHGNYVFALNCKGVTTGQPN